MPKYATRSCPVGNERHRPDAQVRKQVLRGVLGARRLRATQQLRNQQVHDGHVDENAGRQRAEQALRNERRARVGVEGCAGANACGDALRNQIVL